MMSGIPGKRFLAVVLFMSLMVQSCGRSPAPSPSPLPAATVTATSATTNTPRPTRAVTSTPDEVATLHAMETASVASILSNVEPAKLETYPSGDGNWEAELIRYDCMSYPYPDYTASIAYEQLTLVNLSDGTDKIIEDQLQNCDGIGGGGLKGLYWSPNNRYFYYTDWREGYPETCGNYTLPMIYRFDTLAQENISVGGGHLSPDETKLAMWDGQKNEILIWDLDQGEIERVESLGRVQFHGEISWSPDAQTIVYLQTEWDCAPDYGKTYLTRLNLTDLSQELLLEHEAPGFGRVHWGTVDQLILWDGNNKEWTFDISRKELKAPLSATTTPVPSPTGQFNLSEMSVEEWSSTSPDGKWTAVGLVAFPEQNIGGQFAYVRLHVFSADGKTHWTIIDEWQEIGLGFPTPSPLKWSQDGRHFYFTHRAIPDGCSAFPFLTDLQKVDLETGSVEVLLADPAGIVAVSPDDSQIAYSYFSGRPEMGLAVMNLNTGEVQETKIDPGKAFNAGNMLWSPDGKKLVLTLAINPCTGEFGRSRTVWAESTTILLVDAETLQQEILIEEDPRLFITVEWKEPQKIVITDGEENSIWQLDVNTGEINRP